MAEAYLGEIRLIAFNYAPEGWLLCQGQTLQVNQYQALFAVIGNVYGGDGATTFQLPDLRGRVPVQSGQGPLGSYIWGQVGGTTGNLVNTQTAFTITSINQLPAHTHGATFTPSGGGASEQPTVTLKVSNDPATSPTPLANGYMAGLKPGGLGTPPYAYVATATNGTTALNTNAAVASGGSGGITGGSVAIAATGAVAPSPIVAPISFNVPSALPPFLVMNYMICLNGYFPSRP
jgi:microcystin-dependent protein